MATSARKVNNGSRRYDVLRAVNENPRASLRELMKMTGLHSTSVVSYHLDQLEAEGKLMRDRRTARGIYPGNKPEAVVRRTRLYSPKTYAKKAAAGRKGRGVNAGGNAKRDVNIEARIAAIGAREDQRTGNQDVVNGEHLIRLSGLRATKLG